jgi:1,2-diacylglycerol 3-alpha-glucosyltransferase
MGKSLKIAFYTDSFLPAVDGVVVSVLNFRKGLQRKGHEVHIFAGGNSRSRELTKAYKNIHIISGVSFRKYPQYNLALIPFQTSFRVLNNGFDINHAHTPFMIGLQALFNSRIDRKPFIGTFHTLFTDNSVIREYTVDSRVLRRLILKYSWHYARFFYGKCDRVIAPSATIKSVLEKNRIGNVGVVPNSVDLERFNTGIDGSKVRASLKPRRGEKIVLYAGRLSREKRLETMIKAASLMKRENVRFVIAGTGPAAEYYKNMVKRYHLNEKFEFAGFVANSMLPEYYAAADAFCIPSKFETQGIAPIEAMACGKPVIGADYLALKELIINGKNGEKFSPDDHRSCARKIRKVIYNIESYKSMPETAKEYSIEKTTEKLLDAYYKTLY